MMAIRYEPVEDGEYEYLIGRNLYIEQNGQRVGIDFDVYDCNTGDWHPMPHYTDMQSVRLCQATEVAEPGAVVPDSIREAIRMAAETRKHVLMQGIPDLRESSIASMKPYINEMDNLLAWLDQQEGGSDEQ